MGEKKRERTCGECEFFLKAPCECGVGWCDNMQDFVFEDDEACDAFCPVDDDEEEEEGEE